MMLASACLMCLVASSLAVPVTRSDAGEQLLAAMGQGAGAALGQATGDLLAHGLTTAVDAAVGKLTPLISSGLTKALGFLGKRDDTGDLLLQALAGSTGEALGTALGTTAGELIDQGVHAAINKGTPLIKNGFNTLLGKLGKKDLGFENYFSNLLKNLSKDQLATIASKMVKRDITSNIMWEIEKGNTLDGAIDKFKYYPTYTG